MKEKLQVAKNSLKLRLTELHLLKLFKEGHINGTVHTSIGQEVIPVMLKLFTSEDDWCFSNHRGHSHYLARTNDFEGLLAEVMSRPSGCAGGYGGSQHLIAKNFYSNGIQGGMSPIASGVANVLKNQKNNNISIIHIGDGTLGQGVLYESLNICGIFNLPVLYIMEDNGIAQSTFTDEFKLENLEKRISGFGVSFFESSSDDWEDLYNCLKEAVENTRKQGPTLVRIKTRRLLSHSKGDDNRDDSIINENNLNDPLNKLIDENEEFKKIKDDFNIKLRKISDKIQEEEPLAFVNEFTPIYLEESKLKKLDDENIGINIKTQIYQTIDQLLFENGTFVGEDIKNTSKNASKEYGGAFKVSGDLSDKYPNSVINFPISEQSIVGFATGVALAGEKAISEIMFGDFTTLILDQVVQHISKFTTMYGREVPLSLLIRTPMGGRRGYGPTHSQSFERFFIFHQGMISIAANHRTNLKKVLIDFIQKKKPVMLFEHKGNYLLKQNEKISDLYQIYHTENISKDIVISPVDRKPEYTIFCYGFSLKIAEELIEDFKKLNIFAEIICPTVISPINILPLLKSAIKTKKIIFIEEGSGKAGLSSACLSELVSSNINLKYAQIYGNETIIPASLNAELELLDFKKKIIHDIIKSEGHI